jgi:6,7-dimethyl-8-ribityllumazine synthase
MKKNNKILIVSSKYYQDLLHNMEEDTRNVLDDAKKVVSSYQIAEAPGVFEIPVIIARNIKKYDGFVALGCVIKGETPHFDFISTAATDGIMKISIENRKPIGNGIITCLNKKQAEVRSKTKGREAAQALVSVLSQS